MESEWPSRGPMQGLASNEHHGSKRRDGLSRRLQLAGTTTHTIRCRKASKPPTPQPFAHLAAQLSPSIAASSKPASRSQVPANRCLSPLLLPKRDSRRPRNCERDPGSQRSLTSPTPAHRNAATQSLSHCFPITGVACKPSGLPHQKYGFDRVTRRSPLRGIFSLRA